MSSPAGNVSSDDSEDIKELNELNEDDISDTPESSADETEQDSSSISASYTGSDAVNNLQDQESPHERYEPLGRNDKPAAAGAFSMAQALGMVRQRREQEQMAAEAKAKEIQAQRLEKVRERRRRQRKNQKLRKAQLKLEGKNLINESKSSQDDQRGLPQESGLLAPSQSGDTVAGGSEPHTSNELKRVHESAIEDGDAMLKRLPVKKRIRLESASHLLAQDKPVDGARNNSDNANKPNDPTASNASAVAHATAANGNSARSQINRFIPRALLLKMGKAAAKKT